MLNLLTIIDMQTHPTGPLAGHAVHMHSPARGGHPMPGAAAPGRGGGPCQGRPPSRFCVEGPLGAPAVPINRVQTHTTGPVAKRTMHSGFSIGAIPPGAAALASGGGPWRFCVNGPFMAQLIVNHWYINDQSMRFRRSPPARWPNAQYIYGVGVRPRAAGRHAAAGRAAHDGHLQRGHQRK